MSPRMPRRRSRSRLVVIGATVALAILFARGSGGGPRPVVPGGSTVRSGPDATGRLDLPCPSLDEASVEAVESVLRRSGTIDVRVATPEQLAELDAAIGAATSALESTVSCGLPND